MEVGEIRRWLDLTELCSRFSIGEWIFRGVPNRNYRLIPAIGRPGARRSLNGLSLPYDLEQARLLLKEFKLRARPYVSADRGLDDLEWLAIGRHHGLPTAFLDWTRSPLVAAFFACQGVANDQQEFAAIYAARTPPIVSTLAEAEAAPGPVAFLPPHISPRISAQQSLLTYHPAPELPWEPDNLIRYDIIPGQFASALRGILHKAGINESVLMPGLDGIAADLAWLYEREFLRRVTVWEDRVLFGHMGLSDEPLVYRIKAPVAAAKPDLQQIQKDDPPTKT